MDTHGFQLTSGHIIFLITVVGAIAGFWRTIVTRLDDQSKDSATSRTSMHEKLNALSHDLLKNYVQKSDFERALNNLELRMKEKFEEVRESVDHLSIQVGNGSPTTRPTRRNRSKEECRD